MTKCLNNLNQCSENCDVNVKNKKIDKTDVNNDDAPFVCCLIFLPGPRNRSGRVWIYFCTSQKNISRCFTPLHCNADKKFNHATLPVKQTGIMLLYFSNIFLLSLFNWDNIPATAGISFGPRRDLFTFLVELFIPTSSSCTHMEASFSASFSLGRVQSSWRNG